MKNSDKIAESFEKYFAISREKNDEFYNNPKDFLTSQNIKNEGADKFFNDCILAFRGLASIDKMAFKPMKKAFIEMLHELNLERNFFFDHQLLPEIKKRIYKNPDAA